MGPMSESSIMSLIFLNIFSIFTLSLFIVARLVVRRRTNLQANGSGYAVFITGCDTGFGHHLALRLDARGFAVFAGCLFPDGEGAQDLKRKSSASLLIVPLDITSNDDVRRARELVQRNLPEKGLWAVVNNAGVSDWSETEWSTIYDYQNMVDINLFGSIRTTIAFLPLVRASRGRMVFVSSIFAFFNCLNMGAYSVSKRGLEAFADCVRVETDSFGVKVSIIQPANFGQATSILKEKSGADIWDRLDEERKQMFNRQYMDLAVDYFTSLCKLGIKDPSPVVNAMLDAIVSPRPRSRYLVASSIDRFFFLMFPYLPTFVTDTIFSLSSMHGRRRSMLYSK